MKLTAYLMVLLAAWLTVGPWGVAGVLLALALPVVRRGVRPSLRWAVVFTATVAAGVVTVLVLPDGRLPIPPGGGLLVTPRYVGQPATPRPVTVDVPQHPHLAPNGLSSMHNDAWATDSYAGPGPLGRSPDVDTAWFGVEECATLAFTARHDLVGLCGDVNGPTLHLIDTGTMRKRDSLDLPDRPAGREEPPWKDLCAGAYFYLDDADRAVVATSDRRILEVETDGDLTVARSHDLTRDVAGDDCVVALMPDWRGRIWFATEQGRVGVVDPATGRVERVDLDERVANSLAADEDGGIFVVTDTALYRLEADEAAEVAVDWRSAYDRGSGTKPGQLSHGSGTTPTVLPGGLVVITDNAEPRMHVVALRTVDGSVVCRVPVFAAGASATDNSLVSVGDAVVVENNHGYSSPLSTTWGRATEPGLTRVDVSEDGCEVAWTSDEIAPSSVPKVSLANGLLYAYTTRPSRWLVSAWYLTAVDVRTGRTAFSVRTGTGLASNNHYAAVTLAPDGAAFIATLTGLVRVRDR